jgi:hypothetical protein
VTLLRPRRLRLASAAALLALSIPVLGGGSAWAQTDPGRDQPAGRQDAVVEGVVRHPDGSPAEGVAVEVVGYDDAGLAGALVAVFSLGLACIADSASCVGTSTDGGGRRTAADGSYRGSLPDSYVPGTETDTDWVVTASLPKKEGQVEGPRSAFEFEVNIAVQAAPPLALWEETPSVSLDGWRATVSVGAPPEGTNPPALWFSDNGQARVLVGDDGDTLDLRHLESATDDSGVVHAYAVAHADVRVRHANGRTIYHQDLLTATVALPPIGLVPPSRRARCSMVDSAGAPVPQAGGGGCPVTDGNRVSGVPEGARSVVVELATMTDVADVFVVGCSQGCTVEASADGTTWWVLTNDPTIAETYASPSEALLVASSDAPQAGRFVRVTRPDTAYALSEVSVWPGAPTPTRRATTGGTTTGGAATSGGAGSPAGDPTRPAFSEGQESSDGGWNAAPAIAIGLAALALLGAGTAFGVVWARRQT